LPPDADAAIAFALVGGFVEAESAPSDPKKRDVLSDGFQRLEPFWEEMAPVLDATRTGLLRFGILPPDYDRKGSAVLLAWRQGADPETLARRTGLTSGAFDRLTQKAADLWQRVSEGKDENLGGAIR
jgi:hypothetical protein